MPSQQTKGDVSYYPLTAWERASGNRQSPRHMTYHCGACGHTTNGRIVCETQRKDGAQIAWCICSCDRAEPTTFIVKGDEVISQLPIERAYHSSRDWPGDLAALYEEAAKSYSAGAYTACAMLCRKLLMACACAEGDAEGRTFAQYVDYIIANVLTLPKAKATIDAIRGIGNEANHKVQFVAEPDAKKAMDITTYLMRSVYSIPTP